jgi:hypothetical protein
MHCPLRPRQIRESECARCCFWGRFAGMPRHSILPIFSDSFSQTVGLTLTANRVYTVTMIADAFAAAGSSGTGAFGSAFIDPVFSSAPGAGQGYSFAFSPGIGNSAGAGGSPVPEPESFLLLAAGVAVLVAARPHKR